jgi:hypothetical protein
VTPRIKTALRQLADDSMKQPWDNPEIFAIFIEIQNLTDSVELFGGCRHNGTSDRSSLLNGTERSSATPISALLKIQMAIRAVHDTTRHGDMEGLTQQVLEMTQRSPNTATRMLEAIPDIVHSRLTVDMAVDLYDLYMDVCGVTEETETRALALRNLAGILDHLLNLEGAVRLPEENELGALWARLQAGSINPNLSNALIRVSGPIMATITLRGQDGSTVASGMNGWGLMMSDAGFDDQVSLCLYMATKKKKKKLILV